MSAVRVVYVTTGFTADVSGKPYEIVDGVYNFTIGEEITLCW